MISAKPGSSKLVYSSALMLLSVLLPPLASSAPPNPFPSPLVKQAAEMRVLRKQYKQALALLLSASAQDQKDADYDEELTYSLLGSGELDRCIKEATIRLKKQPHNYHLYRSRAVAYERKKEYQKAIADYTKQTEIRPMDSFIYRDRAELYKLTGQFQLAQNDLTTAANIKKYNEIALDNASLNMTLLLKNGHYKEAERVLPQYLAGKPRKIFYLSDIAKLFAASGRTACAISCATRYLQLTGEATCSKPLAGVKAADETAVRELLVSLYLQQQKSDQALSVLNAGIDQWEPLIKQAPAEASAKDGRARINISRLLIDRAEIYMAQGKRESARGDLERSLSLFPDASRAKELMNQLNSRTK